MAFMEIWKIIIKRNQRKMLMLCNRIAYISLFRFKGFQTLHKDSVGVRYFFWKKFNLEIHTLCHIKLHP